MRHRHLSAVLCTVLIAPLPAVQAAPVQFIGQATVATLQASNGYLADFLGTTPQLGDTLEFSMTYDPDTLGLQQFVGPDTVSYSGGITSATFTLNGVTLDTVPDAGASVIVTALDTPPVLGIPGFFDGYSITAGGATGQDGRRWALNFFFFGANGGLSSLAAPTTLPEIAGFQFAGLGFRSFRPVGNTEALDGFGAQLDTLAPVPAPAAAWLFATATLAALTRARRNRPTA